MMKIGDKEMITASTVETYINNLHDWENDTHCLSCFLFYINVNCCL